jgi:GDPmannose 4,6-dehydratase
LKHANIDFKSIGSNSEEKFFDNSGNLICEIDPKFYRPAEVHKLCGDPFLAESELGWERKTNFESLVKKMYDNDYKILNS